MSTRPILRRCVSCRKLLDRQQFWRVIRDHKVGVVLDVGVGRSAYLCNNKACIEDAHRRKRLQKALRCQVPVNVVEVLKERLNCSKNSIAKAI